MTHSHLYLPGDAPRSLLSGDPTPETRFLSKEACRALADRINAKAAGGGQTYVGTLSTWLGNFRWARNRVTTCGDVQDTALEIGRTVKGAGASMRTNALDDDTLQGTIAQTERLLQWSDQPADSYPVQFQYPESPEHPISKPDIWFDSTYNFSAEARARVVEPIVAEATKAGVLTAGFLQVAARGYAVARDERSAVFRYYPMTAAQFSITVRDARGTRSGWAGVDFADWTRIDTAKLARIAMDKCERSANAVAVEPGRFTAILEPQAVADLFESVVNSLSRELAEDGRGPFASSRAGYSKIGERVLDERITLSADPMDPDLGCVPFDWAGEPFLKVNWIENGILKDLSYSRYYGVSQLQKDWALPNSYAYRLSGGATTIDEMIATTERGVLVTRLHGVMTLDQNTLLSSGVTRDGLWLIERGKISKAIKNFRFTESPLFAFNNVDQLGVPQRVFRPHAPAVCPPIKVRDFSFTGLMDAV